MFDRNPYVICGLYCRPVFRSWYSAVVVASDSAVYFGVLPWTRFFYLKLSPKLRIFLSARADTVNSFSDRYSSGTSRHSASRSCSRPRCLSISVNSRSVETWGSSGDIRRCFDLAGGRFFIEPEAQLAGVREGGMDYTASNGLLVHGDNQTSLQGRLGGRLGVHFDLTRPGDRTLCEGRSH